MNKHSVFIPERNKAVSTYWVKKQFLMLSSLSLSLSSFDLNQNLSRGYIICLEMYLFCNKSYHSLLTKPCSNITRLSYGFLKLGNHHNVRHHCINIYKHPNHSCKCASTLLTSTTSFPWSKAASPSVVSISQAVNKGNYILSRPQ